MFLVATMLFGKGMPDVTGPFIFVAIAGVVSVILILLFKPSNVKKVDDKYRAAAGKPLDDVLVGRK